MLRIQEEYNDSIKNGMWDFKKQPNVILLKKLLTITVLRNEGYLL